MPRCSPPSEPVIFTIADDPPRPAVDAAIRAALRSQRTRLECVQVDVLSDDAWPEELNSVVEVAQARLRAGRARDITLDLDPRDDTDFDIALALGPYTIGGTGLSTSGHIVWSSNDTGSSAGFELTPAEEEDVRAAITAAGGAAEHLVTLSSHRLSRKSLTALPVGGTTPGAERWTPPHGFRAYERTVRLGTGPDVWTAASTAVLAWGVKIRSGFTVEPSHPSGVRPGERYWLVAHLGPVQVREPVEIVATVVTDQRAGFAYGTLDGHPMVGEEAFIVHRDQAGVVSLTLRSLTRAGRGRWRPLFPLVLIAQRVYRARYLRALGGGSGS
ncbi:DUF1990 family protein [Xylanimonas sp. McL0601]|uniref:DUF1990 family protein n=1 Tax=Xylanimonas sp. McL0601 TaxID=3414739 RepID=UPI003CF1C3A4